MMPSSLVGGTRSGLLGIGARRKTWPWPSSRRSSAAVTALKSSLRVSRSASVTSSSSASRSTESTIIRPGRRPVRRRERHPGRPPDRPIRTPTPACLRAERELACPRVAADDEHEPALRLGQPKQPGDGRAGEPVQHDRAEDHDEDNREHELGAARALLRQLEAEGGRRRASDDPARRHPGDECPLARREPRAPGRDWPRPVGGRAP